MQPQALQTFIAREYAAEPDYPWQKYPEYAVFRHSNGKWFALLMKISAEKIGRNAKEGEIWVVNLKNRPEQIGDLRMLAGIYPAYHMNKEHWISLNLKEIPDDLLKSLVDESFRLTAK